ncbi:MAG: AarF/UbiB family protein [Verrucomicrobiota bacterium]
MPRNRPKSDRLDEAARLRRLREMLGLTQRQLAKEFKVAHGAIAAWESGRTTLPGPALKVMEIYEAELGIVAGTEGLPRLKTSLVSRSLALSRVAGGLFARAVGTTLERMIASDTQADAIRTKAHAAVARNLARTLGELKGLAMKVGQTLSYVDFALPADVRAEFETLLTQSRPMTPAAVTQVFLEDFGEPPGALFAEWSAAPFAAASIGQLHRARLHSGEEVAVKVQYPAIVDTLLADLQSCAFADRLTAGIFRGQARGLILAEMRERFTEECDYQAEAENTEKFRLLWAGRRDVRIPRIYPEPGSKRVLVMEYLRGESFAAFNARATPAEKNRAGAAIWQFAFESIFKHHLFNADPHPGNYLFADGAVIFLDFGCIKRFPDPMMARWRELLRATLERRFDRTRQLWIELGNVPDPRRFDFGYNLRMLQKLYEPWLSDAPFRFTPEYVESTWRVLVLENPNKFRTNMPKDWVFANRLQWGLGCILARLGATANYRQALLDLIYEAGEPRPPPYSPDELALLEIGTGSRSPLTPAAS